MPLFKKAYWSLVGLGGLYVLLLLALTNPSLQRKALYLNSVNTVFWHDLGQPEQWGFLNGQVQSQTITTPDGETLYSWLILPTGAIDRYEAAIEQSKNASEPFRLSRKSDTKLVISFHGNAGHVGQGWRTDTYRALTAADNDNLHILTVDYRGFGHSTGTPTEQGLILDGISTVKYAMKELGIPPERVVLVGQSLGVAVTIAVAEHFAVNESIEFKGLVLGAGFSDLTTLLQTYAIGHAIPVFSPLRGYPRILNYFTSRIVDTWWSSERLFRLVKASKNINLAMLHARNDYDIPWKHSQTLFYTAVNATSNGQLSAKDIDAAKNHQELTRGGFIDSWKAAAGAGGTKRIKFTLLRDGGHNRIMTFAPVTKAVIDAFASG